MHRSSFVNIIGNPNVGKSSLTNSLLGHKLSIITSKAQTTRHRILAILNEENYQLVISDTPGIIKPAHKLHETMMDFVSLTTEDADILLYVVEYKDHTLKDEKLFSKIKKINIPVILVINKIDLIDQNKLNDELDYWKLKLPNAEIWPISEGITYCSSITRAAPRPVPGPIKREFPLNGIPSFMNSISFRFIDAKL